MDNLCSWCQATRWQYKCFTCDPRRAKTLCFNCSVLWHSRGFAVTHQLMNRYGAIRSFSAWMRPQQKIIHNVTRSLETEVQKDPAIGLNDVVIGVQDQEIGINGMEVTTPTGPEKQKKLNEEAAKDSKSSPEEKKREDVEEEVYLMEEEAEFKVVGESMDIGEDEDTMCVEEIKLKEKTTTVSEKEALARDNFVSRASTSVKRNGHLELKDQEEHKNDASVPIASTAQGVSSVPFSAPPADANSPVQNRDASAGPVEKSTDFAASSTAPVSSTITPDTAIALKPHELAETNLSNATSQSLSADLEKLLRCFPTTDPILMEMLAQRIEAALVIEDALICARIGKCQESSCRSVLLHYEHYKRDKICSNPKCTEISKVYQHRRDCSKKDNASTRDNQKFVCPFCIRIRQRRNLGVVVALDHLISDQRRALQGAYSEANRNACLQTINTWNKRKQVLRDEIDGLNRLASESNALIYNFPRYQWHFGDVALIKREPILLGSESNTVGLSAPGPSMNCTNRSTATEQPSSTRSGDEYNSVSGTLQSEDIHEVDMTGDARFDANFINELLRAKSDAGDGGEMSQREFDGVMELGCAIVDASFCAPSKAQRCLLNCKSILIHLQHHLDLQVCNQAMCAAVEHHFSHLSQCKARDNNESCEYCLRVEECQLMRSVDFMEAEQLEAEAKVQQIINDITASFTNHRPDDREREVIQLEDELEQAEANKQQLLTKLSTARMNLRKVRRSMEHHGMSTSTSRQLPVHFIKVRRTEGSGSSSKKRRLSGSLD
ncbi:unnamed protein product [Peronospora farinosa]|uniref:TAZ-type domain-containing protein n=1 Tax=Peronospora farinosa TaxID=134698 RepID=A0ABN8CHJ4_9STRA|nr:unnamed protein product [Peronospora farinosa]